MFSRFFRKVNLMSNSFWGKYAEARSRLDYSWHDKYSRRRQLMQDKIIDNFLEGISKSTRNPPLLLSMAAVTLFNHDEVV